MRNFGSEYFVIPYRLEKKEKKKAIKYKVYISNDTKLQKIVEVIPAFYRELEDRKQCDTSTKRSVMSGKRSFFKVIVALSTVMLGFRTMVTLTSSKRLPSNMISENFHLRRGHRISFPFCLPSQNFFILSNLSRESRVRYRLNEVKLPLKFSREIRMRMCVVARDVR